MDVPDEVLDWLVETCSCCGLWARLPEMSWDRRIALDVEGTTIRDIIEQAKARS